MRQLGAFFASLREAGTRLSIITKGNVGACRYLLEQEGLLQFFEQVFGMLGQFYGESDFDRANQEPSPLEGSSDCELRESKANLIRSLMSRESLSAEEACLVEDDPQEISSVKGICLSVFVSARQGMTATEMEELRRLSGAEPPDQSAAGETPAARTVSQQAVAPEAKPQTAPLPEAPKAEAAEAKSQTPPRPEAPKAAAAETKPQTAPPLEAPQAVAAEAKSQTAPLPGASKAVAPEAKPQTLPPPPPPPDGLSGICRAGGKSVPPAKGTAPAAPKPAAMQQEQSGQRSLKQVYFDFDQTISKIHVFKQLAGWESGVEAPHALSERGQIHRLKMLNQQQHMYQGGTGHVVRCAAGTPGASWTSCALGGPHC